MRRGHVKGLQNCGERIEAPRQLGKAMLHEAVPDDQTQRDRNERIPNPKSAKN